MSNSIAPESNNDNKSSKPSNKLGGEDEENEYNDVKITSLAAAPPPKSVDPKSKSVVPKSIYMYWHSQNPPPLILQCLQTFRHHNPHHTVTLLNTTHLSPYPPPPNFSSLTLAHQSDWNRLTYIIEHGGTYVDASCVCLEPIETWVDYEEERVQGWKSPFARKGERDVKATLKCVNSGCYEVE